MGDYTLGTTVIASYDATVTAVRRGLEQQGFGVLTEIDLAATMRHKLDVDLPPQVILGACRPTLAYQAIQADPSVAAMLPCNVVVRSTGPTTTVVEAFDPDAMIAFAGEARGDALQAVAADAKHRLTSMLDALESSTRVTETRREGA